MAGNSKDSKILAYKDMINQLNKTIAAQTELIQSLQKTLETDRLEKETLRQQIEYLTKKLFGTSSEKRKDIDGGRILSRYIPSAFRRLDSFAPPLEEK